MADATDTVIPRGEDWEIRFVATQQDDRGHPQPIPADTPVTAWLSATYKGNAIAGTTVTLVRRTRQPTHWVAPVAATAVLTALAGYADGDPVYEVAAFPSERRSRKLIVGT